MTRRGQIPPFAAASSRGSFRLIGERANRRGRRWRLINWSARRRLTSRTRRARPSRSPSPVIPSD